MPEPKKDPSELYEEIVSLINGYGLNIPGEADQMLGDATSIIGADEYNQEG